ncbi:uncharacterized protein I206_101123 [Kwoniella pini CBS 10737]|uniref:Mitochondrial protein n=1 Tax=Kwoniella pini CBS 10737 TaxID=1296096 RepID=A0A1B9IB61_9TREE|nr:uncharacterized protein I206_00203 [Kwoniella pini CBS 10737]OCF52902.1 hypothetical protein I206_00203 [Kwoniella pini CBS 10737]
MASSSLLKNIPSIAKLSQKSILEITGPDSTKFLKGLSCKDVDQLKGGYSGFLNASGRILNTTFIFPTLKTIKPGKIEKSYLISYDENSSSSKLEDFLIPFKLRSKIKIENVTEQFDSYSVFGDDEENFYNKKKGKQPIRNWKFGSGGASESQWFWPNDEIRDLELNENEIGCWDLRVGFSYRGMGRQILVPKGVKPSLCSTHDLVETEDYHLRRMLLGIPEGPQEIIPGSALPLESCMDLHGGVDFRKGCYLGQELTVRTYHTGATRKRILPIRLIPLDSNIQENLISNYINNDNNPLGNLKIPKISELEQLEITYHPPFTSLSKKTRSAGKILSFHSIENSIGLGLIRIEFIEKSCWSLNLNLNKNNDLKIKDFFSENLEIGKLTTKIGDQTFGIYVNKGEAYDSALKANYSSSSEL